MTTVVNIHHREPYDVYIGRPSTFGNPYKLGVDGDRDEVLRKYTRYILSRCDLLKQLPKLRNKRLGCFCHPYSCHGDILAALANELRQDVPRFYRASGECVCKYCHRSYADHDLSYTCLSYNGNPYLHFVCNGDLVKL